LIEGNRKKTQEVLDIVMYGGRTLFASEEKGSYDLSHETFAVTSVKVPVNLWRRFKVACIERGLSVQVVHAALLAKVLGERPITEFTGGSSSTEKKDLRRELQVSEIREVLGYLKTAKTEQAHTVFTMRLASLVKKSRKLPADLEEQVRKELLG
jgi:hypothetical protein